VILRIELGQVKGRRSASKGDEAFIATKNACGGNMGLNGDDDVLMINLTHDTSHVNNIIIQSVNDNYDIFCT
jgi:hypothetical protein